MLLGLEVTLFYIVLLSAVFWLIRLVSVKFALVFLIVANVATLIVADYVIAAVLVGQICLVVLLFYLRKFVPEKFAGAYPWLAFISLVPANLVPYFISGSDMLAFAKSASAVAALPMVGASFIIVKSFVVLKESIKEGRIDAIPALAALTFIPSYPAGPIHGIGPWKPSNLASHIGSANVFLAIAQLGWGIASLYVISPQLRGFASGLHAGGLGDIISIYVRFAALYFDFSGYSLMAIALAGLFGVTLPQNFNRPYLATSIREFWRRWHMTLNWFVGTYLFKPFVRVTGSPRRGIFLAFVCVGIWHEFSVGYLLWGIGHGFALSLAMDPPAFWTKFTASLPRPVATFINWALTMSWVALLSHTATVWLGVR
ncbi:MAG: hypothetical protein H6873_01020 [Hyphomicrobiaceae bacterium]|nr:hypothetical protein [Hyphomicrobiaceae bacterium]